MQREKQVHVKVDRIISRRPKVLIIVDSENETWIRTCPSGTRLQHRVHYTNKREFIERRYPRINV